MHTHRTSFDGRRAHRLAAYYRRRADIVRGQTVLSPRAAGYVGLHESFERIANGRLSEAREALGRVVALFKVRRRGGLHGRS